MMIDPDRSSLNIKARVVRIVKEGNRNGVGFHFNEVVKGFKVSERHSFYFDPLTLCYF